MPSTRASQSGRPRLLVVDDEQSNRVLAARILGTAGYDVVTASGGDEALTLIGGDPSRFDLFVLDVMMPGMRGTELAERILALDPEAKILYFTAYSETLFHATRHLDANQAFVDKPATSRDLREAVSLILFDHLRGPEAQ